MHPYRMWISIFILYNIVADAKCAFLDIDENLVFKICNMKFCDATKTDVSFNRFDSIKFNCCLLNSMKPCVVRSDLLF